MARTSRKRNDVDPRWRWNLRDLYPSRAAWKQDLERLERAAHKVRRFRSRLDASASGLADCLDAVFDLLRRLRRLETYAGRLHDQDASAPAGQDLNGRAQKARAAVEAACAFLEPGVLAIAPAKLQSMLQNERLAPYRQVVRNITRRRKHVLPPAGEELLARARELAAVPTDVYRTLGTMNMPFPDVEMDGEQRVALDQAVYTRLRASPDRDLRLRVFQGFFGTYKRFRETYAALLAGGICRNAFEARARGYPSDLHAALGRTNVPTAIYHNMLAQVHAGRKHLWRDLQLRRRLMGLTRLGYHDLYASVVPEVRLRFPYHTARDILHEALQPLGDEYNEILQTAHRQRWVDVVPTRGKRSGAYSDGDAYDVHPYVLLNYNDDYESMSIMAHELGHAAHSHLSNTHQPFPMAPYPTFVAEVASTVNEHLLLRYMSRREQDPARKAYFLGQHLENFRTTVFRQALFAEFELGLHQAAWEGATLTADLLDERYLDLLRTVYGEAAGCIQIHPLVAVEWAYVPHFYYNFYMFQYTTSFIAATAIADRIAAGDERARTRYLAMLKAGGSKYPVQLLKKAGVDMRGPQPYRQAFTAMENTLDEIEALLGQELKGRV